MTTDAGQRLIEDLRNRNRELTRQVEQLQARVDAAEKLVAKWRVIAKHPADVLKSFRLCADELASAISQTRGGVRMSYVTCPKCGQCYENCIPPIEVSGPSNCGCPPYCTKCGGAHWGDCYEVHFQKEAQP